MKLNNIKPISYLKANTAEMVRKINEEHEPYVITQNGEAKAVLQDIQSFEKTQETLALLKILALGQQQVEAKQTVLLEDAVKSVRSARNKK